MPLQIALLRAVNVGGQNNVAMADLRALLADLGFADAKSVLQSGNLVFKCGRRSGASLEALLEKETASRLGVSPDYVVRTAAEWQQLVARNPFPKQAKSEPGRLVAMCLKTAPPASLAKELQAAIKGPEQIHLDGKQLYIVYPAGIGTSKLTGTLIERKLETRGTARNWNTVLKLAALCE